MRRPMPSRPSRLLLVEDDKEILRLVRAFLEQHDFEVASISRGCEVAKMLARGFDLILLDLNLPDLDGLEVIRNVRALSQIPILVVSCRPDGSDRVEALDLGADDYLSKPFYPQELIARSKALLRRLRRSARMGSAGYLQLFPERQQVLLGGESIDLTSREYALLEALASEPGRLFSREELLKRVWGANPVDPRRVDLYVSRLRAKLEDLDNQGMIASVYGGGYRLDL